MGALVSWILVLAVTLIVCVCASVCLSMHVPVFMGMYASVCTFMHLRRHSLRSVYLGLETRKSDLDQRHTYKATAAPQQALGLPISASSLLEF